MQRGKSAGGTSVAAVPRTMGRSAAPRERWRGWPVPTLGDEEGRLVHNIWERREGDRYMDHGGGGVENG
jgi:hypothetical protein